MHVTPYEIVMIAIGLIETVARVIPTVGMYAPLGIVLKVLNAVSEFLNRKK